MRTLLIGVGEMVGLSTLTLVALLTVLTACTSTDHRPAPSATTPHTFTGITTSSISTASTDSTTKLPKPRGHTLLGLVVSHTKLADGYRVVLAPAIRQADGQFVAIPGRATVGYLIPTSLVPDEGITLVGPIELTIDGQQVTGLTIAGG
jgi:hypothetical protein